MNISLNNSAIRAISNANQKAASAAQSVASMSTTQGFNNNDITTPIVNMKEAEIQNAAGVKLLQAEKKMLGSILDIRA